MSQEWETGGGGRGGEAGMTDGSRGCVGKEEMRPLRDSGGREEGVC